MVSLNDGLEQGEDAMVTEAKGDVVVLYMEWIVASREVTVDLCRRAGKSKRERIQ